MSERGYKMSELQNYFFDENELANIIIDLSQTITKWVKWGSGRKRRDKTGIE